MGDRNSGSVHLNLGLLLPPIALLKAPLPSMSPTFSHGGQKLPVNKGMGRYDLRDKAGLLEQHVALGSTTFSIYLPFVSLFKDEMSGSDRLHPLTRCIKEVREGHGV